MLLGQKQFSSVSFSFSRHILLSGFLQSLLTYIQTWNLKIKQFVWFRFVKIKCLGKNKDIVSVCHLPWITFHHSFIYYQSNMYIFFPFLLGIFLAAPFFLMIPPEPLIVVSFLVSSLIRQQCHRELETS